MANVYGLIFEIDDNTRSGSRTINRNLDSISKKANAVKNGLGNVGRAASGAMGALGKLGLAATAAATAFGFLAKKNLDALDALGKTASKLGVSTKFLSEFGFVAKQAGIGTDQFQTGLQRFIRRLGQAKTGTGELVKPLKELGINIKDSSGNFREGSDVFEEFLTKLDLTRDAARKLALSVGAFDTEGTDFINLASMGAKEIANLRREAELAGGSISEKLTKAAADANDAIGALIFRASSFGQQFFGNLAPGITAIADDLKKALDGVIADAGGMEAFSRQLAGDFMSGAADVVDMFALVFDGFLNGFNVAQNALKQILSSLPSALTGGVNYEMGSPSGVGHERASILAEIAMFQSVMDEASGFDIAQGIVPFIGTHISDFADAQKQIMFLNEQLKVVDATMAGIEDGSVVFLKQMATDSTSTADAVAGTTAKIREMGTALSSNNDVAMTAEQIREMAMASLDEAIKKEDELMTARYASTNALLETLKPQETALQSMQKHLQDVKNAQDLWYEGFTNGANRMGTGHQEMVRFTGGLIALQAELTKTAAAVALLQRQQEYLEQPELKLIDRHATLTNELMGVEQQMTRVRAEMALAAGDTAAYEFALASLEEQSKRIKGALTPGATTPTSTPTAGPSEITDLSGLQSSLAKDSATAAMNMGIFKDYLASGSHSAADLQDAMSKLGITMDDMPYDTFKEAFAATIDAGVGSTTNLKKLQTELNGLVEKGIKLTETQQKMLNGVNDQLGNSNPYIENIQNALEGLSSSIASNFTDVIFGLKDGFTALEDIALSVLRTIIQTLIETFIKQQMVAAFGGGGGGGILGMATLIPGLGPLIGAGMALGGAFADGGNTAKAGNKPILVGERGPEIFMPGKAGNVVSNEDINSSGGGDLNVNFTLNAVDTQTGVQFLLENKRVITGVIQEAYQRRGAQGPMG